MKTRARGKLPIKVSCHQRGRRSDYRGRLTDAVCFISIEKTIPMKAEPRSHTLSLSDEKSTRQTQTSVDEIISERIDVSFHRHLLADHQGNANKRNRSNQTSLHCLLQEGNEVRRNECLNILLKWKDKHTSETIDLDAKDSVSSSSLRLQTDHSLSLFSSQDDNTALHYAAKNGLKSCLEVNDLLRYLIFSIECGFFLDSTEFRCRAVRGKSRETNALRTR